MKKQIKENNLPHLHVFTCTSCYHPPIKILNVGEYSSVAAKPILSYKFLAETRSQGTFFSLVFCSEAH